MAERHMRLRLFRPFVLYWPMRRLRKGQNTTEYFLLMCAMLAVFGLVGSFIKDYIPKLMDRAFEMIVDAALSLALP